MDEQREECWEPAAKCTCFAKHKLVLRDKRQPLESNLKIHLNGNFNTWATNRLSLGHPVPECLLESHNAKLLCKYLSLYIMETRREDGKPYPLILFVLLSGINRILQANKAPFSVLDKSNPDFRDPIKTLDTMSSKLHREGVGVVKESAPVITSEHKDLF